MDRYYETANANVHRGAYWLAEKATEAMEQARDGVRRFVGGRSDAELIFTRNATEGINLVAHSYGRQRLRAGDVVLLSHLEHHSNIVPWQILAAERGVEDPLDPPHPPQGELDLSDLDRLLEGVKLVGVSAQSNVLGTMPPVAEVIARRPSGRRACQCRGQFVPHHTSDVRPPGTPIS